MSDEVKRRVDAYRAAALAKFPFKLVETTGDRAFAKWRELKASAEGTPVVLGGDDEQSSFDSLLTPFGPNGPNYPRMRTVEEILERADGVKFPDDLASRNKAASDAAIADLKAKLAADPNMPLPTIIENNGGKQRAYTREETIAAMLAESREPPIGDWPPSVPRDGAPYPTVAYDILTGKPLQKVYIGIAPTKDWTTIPAYLRYGNWNACPAAEYHVAAMRQWRDRYGAELVGISSDTINLRVARKPQTREEALGLARDQYVYCNDIIDQGAGTYSALAAELMASDWWYFWWD